MADELTQSGFDNTIENFKKEVLASDEQTRADIGNLGEAIDSQTEAIERSMGRSLKAVLKGITSAQTFAEQVLVTQQVNTEEKEEKAAKQQKKQIFLLSNIKNTIGGLVTITLRAKLSDIERKREEQRTNEAMLGIFEDIGSVLGGIKKGFFEALKLAANPLGLISAILGIAIGTIAGFGTQIFQILKLGPVLKALFKPIRALLSPKSRLGKLITGAVSRVVKVIGFFIRIFGSLGKQIPLLQKMFRALKPFIKAGKILGRFLGRIAVPLTIVISVFKAIFGFVDELKKGGDLIDATLRAFGDVLDFLTFGLLNADMLKKFIGEPIRNFIGGIKELFTEGFSFKTLKKIAEPLRDLLLAGPNLLIQVVGKLIAFAAKLLGFKDFADKLKAFLAEFDLFEFIETAVKTVVKFFKSLPEKLAKLPEAFGEIVAKIKNALISGIVSIFNRIKEDPIGLVKDIGTSIVDMFTKIVTGLFEFIVEKLAFTGLVPKELEEQVAQQKKLRALQKELGNVSEEEARAELERRQVQKKQLEALDKERDELLNAMAEARKQGRTDLVAFHQEELTKVLKAIEKIEPVELQRGGIVSKPTLARVAETHAEAVIPLHRLDDLIVNPAIAAALNLAKQIDTNARLQDKRTRGQAPLIAPINNTQITAPAPPAPIIAPIAVRNNENILRRLMEKDFRGAQT